jgi:hypothetical protein
MEMNGRLYICASRMFWFYSICTVDFALILYISSIS